jgi:hypothetical protein
MSFRVLRLMALVLLGTGALAMTGCSELLGNDNDDNNRSSDRDTISSRDKIPTGARILDQGKGALKARTRDPGTIYLYDVDDQRIVWSGRVHSGQDFAVDPDNDRAVLDSEPVYRQNLERTHTHRIYFIER